jgi:mRNA interferase RelE/StbE
MALAVLTTSSFDRVVKKLHPKDKKVLDAVVAEIMDNPFFGEEKRGDLAGVFVFKFKLNSQETLLAYKLQPDKRNPTEFVLMSVGPHGNFYSQLKRSV